MFRWKTPTHPSNTWKSLTKRALCTCRWTVQHMYNESNALHTVSASLLHPDTPFMSGLPHTHTLAVHMPLFLPAFPEQVCGTLRSENFGVRSHQHLLSPQSWIWVFSCSVSQENRADLPSSSSYFRSLTKCCKNTDKLTVICILSKRLYGWYRNQSILLSSSL